MCSLALSGHRRCSLGINYLQARDWPGLAWPRPPNSLSNNYYSLMVSQRVLYYCYQLHFLLLWNMIHLGSTIIKCFPFSAENPKNNNTTATTNFIMAYYTSVIVIYILFHLISKIENTKTNNNNNNNIECAMPVAAPPPLCE